MAVGRWGRAPPPAFHALAKDMSLIEAQHILHYDKGHDPSYYKYTCVPLSKLPSCAPGTKP